MPNFGKSSAGPSTKSSDDSLVGFQLEELKTHYLPSIKELMQRVIYEKNQIKIKENCLRPEYLRIRFLYLRVCA